MDKYTYFSDEHCNFLNAQVTRIFKLLYETGSEKEIIDFWGNFHALKIKMQDHFEDELIKCCKEHVLKPLFFEFQTTHIKRFDEDPSAMVAADYGLLMLNYYIALALIDTEKSRKSIQEINHYYDQQDLSIYEIIYS